ncbi:MAG: hypothetical protein ACKE9I_07375 [Methylophagaceae bacterium]
MTNWIILALILPLFSVWLWLHYSKSSMQPKQSHTKKTQSFHGISIHQCSAACANVKSLHGKRFLAREVMSLPIFGCTSKECTCTYVHHNDRRNGGDRRFPTLAMANVFSDHEHRVSKIDRRQASFA